MLIHESCQDFTKLLASKTPVPGGGGAAALVGALGAALCSMVGNFTVGKKKYAEFEDDVKSILVKAGELQARLLELVDKDAEAFAPLAEAYGIPKDDPERESRLEAALLNACTAPIEMIKCCDEVVDLLKEMLEKGSKLLISDVGCGAVLCRAAVESAAINVFVNTALLKNREDSEKLESLVDETSGRIYSEVSEIVDSVTKFIRK